MITVPIHWFIYMLIGVIVFTVILFVIDYLKNRPFVSRQERELKDLLYDLFNQHWYANEERAMQLKWVIIFLLIISLLYGILFKLPIPFIGKPLCVLQKT